MVELTKMRTIQLTHDEIEIIENSLKLSIKKFKKLISLNNDLKWKSNRDLRKQLEEEIEYYYGVLEIFQEGDRDI